MYKVLTNTTLYYKICTKYFPILLWCTRHFPILLSITKPVQRKLLHIVIFFRREIFTHNKLFFNRETFTYRYFYTRQIITQRNFYTQQTFTHRILLYRIFLHIENIYRFRSFYTEKKLLTENLLHTASSYRKRNYTKNFFLYIMIIGIVAPKPDGSRYQSKKKYFETLFKRNFTRKITSAKIEKSADKSQSQPSCNHSKIL